MDRWAHQAGVKLDFIRPGRPVENSYFESFNGRLCDECSNVELFLDLADAQSKIEKWRRDYNQYRPHSALAESNAARIRPCGDATIIRPFRSGKAE